MKAGDRRLSVCVQAHSGDLDKKILPGERQIYHHISKHLYAYKDVVNCCFDPIHNVRLYFVLKFWEKQPK